MSGTAGGQRTVSGGDTGNTGSRGVTSARRIGGGTGGTQQYMLFTSAHCYQASAHPARPDKLSISRADDHRLPPAGTCCRGCCALNYTVSTSHRRDEERGERDEKHHHRKRHRAEEGGRPEKPAPEHNGHEGRSSRDADRRPGHGEVGNGPAVDAAPAAERWPKCVCNAAARLNSQFASLGSTVSLSLHRERHGVEQICDPAGHMIDTNGGAGATRRASWRARCRRRRPIRSGRKRALREVPAMSRRYASAASRGFNTATQRPRPLSLKYPCIQAGWAADGFRLHQ